MNRMENTLIVGIGNEVLVSFVVLVGLFVVTILKFLSRRDDSSLEVTKYDPNGMRPRSYGLNQTSCPICLNDLEVPVQTNCGHIFCGLCLKSMHDYHYFGNFRCPICRQSISHVSMYFSNSLFHSMDNSNIAMRESVSRFVNNFNTRFSSHSRTILTYLQRIPIFFRSVYSEYTYVGAWREMMWQHFMMSASMMGLMYISIMNDYSPVIPMFDEYGYIDEALLLISVIVYTLMTFSSELDNETEY